MDILHIYEVSYPRAKPETFRIVDINNPSNTRYATSIVGTTKLIDTINDYGRLLLETCITWNGNAASFFYPSDKINIPPHCVLIPYTNPHLCYRRLDKDWRVRDDIDLSVTYIDRYEGILNINWTNGKAQLPHIGSIMHDVENKIAYFLPEKV